ncbi:MAG: undecaprenyl/decaprenyl-phosphate alpha-N-acetylglucosaminyl 1-phosphate transferase [Bryobacteraceae bacterium]|nr:undecaprenyl/decaprenyl-phosphate alpha-N-acetylglucosaminyl 1-phosphate transferase [Bryobacteraceae bacterium]
MYSVLLTAVVSFACCLLLTPLVRDAFFRWGIVDRPDGVRKLHARAVPRAGGAPIVISYVGAYLVLLASPLRGGDYLEHALPLVWSLLPAAGLAFATGLLDDVKCLRPLEKLGGQLVAAGLAYSAGVRIESVAGHPLSEWVGLPLTLLWIIGCTNAFNLIDGVDGLATGVGLLATVTILLAALLHQNTPLALATAPLAGCLLGFLRYNFNPASVFMGDSGSLLVGFLLGCYGVIWTQKSVTILGMAAPLMALSLPLMDTGLAVVRRFLRGRPIFGADRGHVHHRLLDRGFTPRRVALLLYGACGVAAAFSLLQSVLYPRYAGLVVVIFLAAAWIGIQKLDYDEFGAARRLFFGGGLQSILDTQITLDRLRRSIAQASTVEQCWAALRDGCHELGFAGVELHFGGQVHGRQGRRQSASWYVYVPLTQADYLLLGRTGDEEIRPGVAGKLADFVRTEARTKLLTLSECDATSIGFATETESLLRLIESVQSYDEYRDVDRPTAVGSKNRI